MALELGKRGFAVSKNKKIQVWYEGDVVGTYYADLVVNEAVLLELKSCAGLVEAHEAQVLNYLRATKYEVGLLMNFGQKATFKRFVFENLRKGNAEKRGITLKNAE